VLLIGLDIARGFDVLRRVDAVVSQRDPNAAQDVSGVGLVVNGIEGGDKVKSARLGLLVEPAEVASNEARFLLPRSSASPQANAMAASERSIPTNRLLGNRVARRFNARPHPQPTSRTRMPSLSRSSRPGLAAECGFLTPATQSGRCLRP
jgi:hypothetical protein